MVLKSITIPLLHILNFSPNCAKDSPGKKIYATVATIHKWEMEQLHWKLGKNFQTPKLNFLCEPSMDPCAVHNMHNMHIMLIMFSLLCILFRVRAVWTGSSVVSTLSIKSAIQVILVEPFI